jgi:hypothetical protein
MSAQDNDRLIARYLDGSMSASEEEEFFVRMALDPELRHAYQAQRIVESALHKYRDRAPRPARDARERMLAVAAQYPATPSRRSGPSAGASWGQMLGVAAATIAVGALLWLGLGTTDRPAERSKSDSTVISSPARPAPLTEEPSTPRNDAHDTAAPTSATAMIRPHVEVEERRETPARSTTAVVRSAPTVTDTIETRAASEPATPSTVDSVASPVSNPENVSKPEETNDSIPLKVRVIDPK